MNVDFSKSDGSIFVGDFVGSCADSPNGQYSIGWYCSKTRGRLDDKNYVLVSAQTPIVWGEVTLRILEGKASDTGRFALHLIGSTNRSTLRFFAPNGQSLGSKQFKEGLSFFDLSADGQVLLWSAGDDLQCLDLATMEEAFQFQLEPRFCPTAARLDGDGLAVLLQDRSKGWYRFERSGAFTDKEKWLLAYMEDCDGPTLYQIIEELSRKQGVVSATEARTYAEWVEEALRRGIEDSFHVKVSSVYEFLAQLYVQAGDPNKAAESNLGAERHLDGFSLVDRAVARVGAIGNPPNEQIAQQVLSDLDRATKTERLFDYPNYIGKLYRTKGEILELLGQKEDAVAAFRKALEANPKAGCKRQLERLTNAPVVLPAKPKPKPIEDRVCVEELTMFHFRCAACGATPKEVGMKDYLADWCESNPGRLNQLYAVLLMATQELKTSRANSTQRFLTAADALISMLEGKLHGAPPLPSPLLQAVAAKTLVMQTDCPVCRSPGGLRRKDDYFTTWSDACRVQSSNLFFEPGVILLGLCSMKPLWFQGELRDFGSKIRSLLFQAGEAIGLMSCPRCGRFTTCLYGGTRSDPESGTCRWCLDAGGTNQLVVTVDLSKVIDEVRQAPPA